MTTTSHSVDGFAPARVAHRSRGFAAAVADFAQGDPVIIGYDGECVMALSAAAATPHTTAELVRHGSGLLFVAMQSRRLRALRIPAMPAELDSRCSNSYVAVDVSAGITTGISAVDRTTTINMLSDPSSTPDTFRRPGHVVPVAADLVVGTVATAPQTVLMLASLAGGDTPAAAFTTLVSVDHPCENATAEEGPRIAEWLGRRFIDSRSVATAFYGWR